MSRVNNPYSYEGTIEPTRRAVPAEPLLYWLPDEHVTLHDGNPIPGWMTFLHFPPEEIGRITSVLSYKSRRAYWGILPILIAPSFIIGGAIGMIEKSWYGAFFYGAIVMGIVIALGAIAYFLLHGIAYAQGLLKIRLRWQQYSFVGEQGFAVWYQDRIFPKEETCEYVLFSKLKELDWFGLRDEGGKLVWKTFNAIFGGSADDQKRESFDRAIELAWHVYYYNKWLFEWEQNQQGELRLSKTDKLLFQQEQIFLQRAENRLPINTADIVKLAFTYDGQLMFYLTEKKLAENQGRLKYWLREMPNCLATMALISRMLKFPITGQHLPYPLDDTQRNNKKKYLQAQ